MKLRQLVSELKGRGVYRVAALYCAGAWALLQVADVMVPLVGLPDWSISMVLVVAAVGFPIALVLAWLFDLTSKGVVEAPPMQPEAAGHSVSPAHVVEFALILLLALLVGYLYLGRLTLDDNSVAAQRDSPGGRTSIAVMPFVMMSGADNIEYLGDGLAEEILNLLAKLNELNVAARTSSFYFKNKNLDIREIARSLGVGHVLEGSVRQSAGRVRVTAQLINADDGFHLWSETYDREINDLLALQDEIATQVVDSLQILLSSESREALTLREKVDPQAYDYYLRARAYLRRPRDESNLENAAGLFRKAVSRHPAFADAYAGLCETYLAMYANNRDIEQFKSAEAACHRALTLDRRAGNVYIALGNLYRHSGQTAKAVDEFTMALSLSPSSPDAHLGLADTYMLDQQPELAGRNYGKALELQPNYWQALMSMGNFHFDTGQVEQAIPYYERIVELMPDSESALSNLASANFMLGHYQQASQFWEKSLALQPSALAYSNLATGLYFQGHFDDALPLYHRAAELSPEDYELWGNLGDSYRYASANQALAQPMFEKALQLAQKRLQVNPDDADTLALMAHYAASIGRREQALEYLAHADPLNSGDIRIQYGAVTALCRLGESERALEVLELALEGGYPLHMVRADPSLSVLADNPRFKELTGQP